MQRGNDQRHLDSSVKRLLLIGACLIALICQPAFGVNPAVMVMLGGKLVAGGGGVTSNPLITGQSLVSPRHDFTSSLGFAFTVGAANITVTDIGRWVISGNSGTHLISLCSGTDGGPPTTLASLTVNTSGATSGAYLYGSITPVTLTAGVTYYIFSDELNGGDFWYDNNDTLTSTADATIIGSRYVSGGNIQAASSGTNGYVPPNFKYHL